MFMLLCAERVLGPGIKKALEIDPDKFDLDLNIEETSLLTHIKESMAPDVIKLRAELYQLNMCASPALLSSRDCPNPGLACVIVTQLFVQPHLQTQMAPHSSGKPCVHNTTICLAKSNGDDIVPSVQLQTRRLF